MQMMSIAQEKPSDFIYQAVLQLSKMSCPNLFKKSDFLVLIIEMQIALGKLTEF